MLALTRCAACRAAAGGRLWRTDGVILYTGTDTSRSDRTTDARTTICKRIGARRGYDQRIRADYQQRISGGAITDVSCSLAVSDDITKYPFEKPDESKTTLDWKAYQKVSGGTLVAWNGDSLGDGEHAYFRLEVTFATGASQGYYQVPFTITYSGGATSTVNVNVYCRGIDTTGGSSGGGSGYKSKPKVIIESYEFTQDPIYAGDTVSLRLIIANTSKREAITNVHARSTRTRPG